MEGELEVSPLRGEKKETSKHKWKIHNDVYNGNINNIYFLVKKKKKIWLVDMDAQ